MDGVGGRGQLKPIAPRPHRQNNDQIQGDTLRSFAECILLADIVETKPS